MHLSKLAVRRPVAVTVFVIIALIFGVISLQRIGIDLLPDMNFPIAVVVTVYPGGAAQTVEQDVTIPIEGALSGISGLRRMDSFSIENVSAIMLQFDWGTDMIRSLDSVRNSLAQTALTLPEGVQAPVVVQVDPNDFPLMLVGVSSQGLSPVALSEQLNRLKPQIEQIPGVAQVSLLGTSAEEIQVLFDADHLNELGLTPVILQQLIMYQNIVVPGGAVTADGVRYTTRAGSQITSVEELENIIVGMKQGSGILGLGGLIPSLTYLSDVAEITTHVAPRDGITRYNGQDTVLIQVMRQTGANTVRVAEDVKKALDKIHAEHPHLEFTTITDQSIFINQSISSLASSGIVGAVLAVAVLLFFLRNASSLLIIALSIPVSIIASFVLIYLSKLSLNLMTLGGLALGVGMLVDSSIVVIENIYRHLTEGKDRLASARDGAGELASALLASTLTNVAVFLPVIILGGMAGQLLKEFGLSISFALASSFLAALTIVPMLASKLLNVKSAAKHKPGTAVSRVRNAYARLLERALSRKVFTFALVVILLVVALAVYPRLDQEFLPSFDEGFLGVQATLPGGLPLEKVREIVMSIEDDLMAIPEVEAVAVQSGDQGELDVVSLLRGTDAGSAQFFITLVPHDQRQRKAMDLKGEVHEIMDKHGVLRTNISDSSIFGSAASAVLTPNLSIEIRGEDWTVCHGLAEELKGKLKQIDGFRDVQDSTFRPGQELFLKVDTSRSILGGFTAGQVGLGMRYATTGLEATNIQVGSRSLPVVLRPNSSIDSVDDLLNTKITSPVSIQGLGENPILLKEVVTLESSEVQTVAQRTDRLPVTYVTGILDDLSLTEAVRHSERIIAEMEIPPGYHIRVGGLQNMISESIGELVLALILAVALVYLVMAAQFESFLQPFIIMFTIPLALVGALAGLWAVGGSLGIISIIGIITLVGIVVNNAIVLVDFINLRRRQNPDLPVRQAILEACQVRLRPILMTSITTIFGLLPVAIGYGVGSEFQRSLAATIMGGMISSTVLTLFVIPTVYEAFTRLERRRKVQAPNQTV